jgi:hypothetical protein
MTDDSIGGLSRSGFQAALQTRFRLRSHADPHIELVLVEVRAVGSACGDAEAGSFAILFHGPADPLLPQRTYFFEHDTLGSFELFIVPIGRDQEGCRYEAVFNHQSSPR